MAEVATPPIEATSTPTPTPVPRLCVADCNGGDTIDVTEVIRGVGIVLGKLSPSACPAFDCSSDCGPGPVRPTPSVPTVVCLIRAINDALRGCAPVPCTSDADCNDGNVCSFDRCNAERMYARVRLRVNSS